MTADVLSRRALNRATLARQLLSVARSAMAPLDAVHHLVGLQAQVPPDPYLALWSRLAGFRPEDLEQLLLDREVVRIVVMRGTIHLVTADDALRLRPLVQPVLDAELARHGEFGPFLSGVDLAPVMAYAAPLLAEQPRTGRQLRALLAERFPDLHSGALAYACRNHLAFVQVPPRGLWRRSGVVTNTTAEAWLGRHLVEQPAIDDAVRRYFSAFGPARVADVATWSRLTGLRGVVDRLRPRLRPFRDTDGRELLDLPDAPRPDADIPGPTRFLPEYDNLLLSHADRSRFMLDGHPKLRFSPAGPVHGSVLHDGFLVGTWHLDREPSSNKGTLVVETISPPDKRAAGAVTAEARRLVQFLTPELDDLDIRLLPPA